MKDRNKHKIHLDDISKKEPMEVPEGYFDHFADRLRDRIREEEARKPAGKSIRMHTARLVAYAAGFILFILASYFMARIIINPQDQNTLGPAVYSEIIEEDVGNYDLDLIYDVYDDLNYESVEEAEEEEYEDYMIDYLVYNDIDMDLILEEF